MERDIQHLYRRRSGRGQLYSHHWRHGYRRSHRPAQHSNFTIITTLGDSKTAGNEDGSGAQYTYPGTIASDLHAVVYNLATPGITSPQLGARIGTFATYVTNSFTIPTTSCGEAVTFTAGFEPAWNASAATKNYYTGVGVLGSVGGVLAYFVDNGNNTFTMNPVKCPTSPVTITGPALWTPANYDLPTGNAFFKGPVGLWIGRNNLFVVPSTVVSDNLAIAATIKAAGATQLWVYGPTNKNDPSEWLGSTNYGIITTAIAGLANSSTGVCASVQTAPSLPCSFLDMRAFMESQANPNNAVDQLDVTHGAPPTSLMAAYNQSALGPCYGTLSAAITTTSNVITWNSLTAACGVWVIDPGQSNQELVFFPSASGGITGTAPNFTGTIYNSGSNPLAGRGLGGTTVYAHSAGATLWGIDTLHESGIANTIIPSYNGQGGFPIIGHMQSPLIKASPGAFLTNSSFYDAAAALPVNQIIQPSSSKAGAVTYLPFSNFCSPFIYVVQCGGIMAGGQPGTGPGLVLGYSNEQVTVASYSITGTTIQVVSATPTEAYQLNESVTFSNFSPTGPNAFLNGQTVKVTTVGTGASAFTTWSGGPITGSGSGAEPGTTTGQPFAYIQSYADISHQTPLALNPAGNGSGPVLTQGGISDGYAGNQSPNYPVDGKGVRDLSNPGGAGVVGLDLYGTLINRSTAVNQNGGDLACAHAGDTTIGQITITGGSTNGTTATVTFASLPNWFYAGTNGGARVGIAGSSISALNGGPYTLATAGSGSTQVTFPSTAAAATLTSGGTMFLWCGNQTLDALASTPYMFTQNPFTVPSNYFATPAATTFTANTTNASQNLTAIKGISGTLAVGMIVSCPGVPALSTIWQVGTNLGNVQVSQNATATATGITCTAQGLAPVLNIKSLLSFWTSATPPGVAFLLIKGGTQGASGGYALYSPASTAVMAASVTGSGGSLTWDIVGPTAFIVNTELTGMQWPTTTNQSGFYNVAVNPVPISSSPQTIAPEIYFRATSVTAITSSSGCTVTGSIGQTVLLTAFNNSSTATATGTLTAANTLAGATWVITAPGSAATANPTSATCGSGTATASGTATLTTTTGGTAGNAIWQKALLVRSF